MIGLLLHMRCLQLVSTPAAKALLGSVHPAVLAGFLYCGAGLGVTLVRWLRPLVAGSSQARETALTRSDLPYLAGAIGAGGVVGPVLLMMGLATTDAGTASLLLTRESAATGLMAWFIFHESSDRRVAFGLLCLVAGAAAAITNTRVGSHTPNTSKKPRTFVVESYRTGASRHRRLDHSRKLANRKHVSLPIPWRAMATTIIAVPMNTPVATIERIERRAIPQTACPEVHPPPMRAPRPTRNPAITIIAQLSGICGVGSG
jgi:hypothetical protein